MRCNRWEITVRSCLSFALLFGVGGCGWFLPEDCGTPHIPPSDEPLAPIAAALRYLHQTQLKADQPFGLTQDYAGDWPQCVGLEGQEPFIRDASPFMATFIHHALTLITEENREVLGLTSTDIETARAMRTAAVALMLRFEAGPEGPDAGTFGFWPNQQLDRLPPGFLLSVLFEPVLPGPDWFGVRAPINFPLYPANLMIPTDADDTAAIYAALLDHHQLDGGPEVAIRFERFFTDWRDLGQVPRRNNPNWLGPNSGAYLTWLAYHNDPAHPKPNDVDLVVNANILYALGRYNRLDTPGVEEAVRLINDVIAAGIHKSAPSEATLYYPDNFALHYCITRARREGGVEALSPAVEALVEDLINTVQIDGGGGFFWDRGDPHLNTAFAVATLLTAEPGHEIGVGAIDYLLGEQDPANGSWEPGQFFGGRLDDGTEGWWVSSALTTAIALEALCRRRLSPAEHQ